MEPPQPPPETIEELIARAVAVVNRSKEISLQSHAILQRVQGIRHAQLAALSGVVPLEKHGLLPGMGPRMIAVETPGAAGTDGGAAPRSPTGRGGSPG